MAIHALHAKATIKGHPIHPMIVGFPIALYTTGFASLVAYAFLRDSFWYRAAMTAWFVGVGLAALAAVFGTLDLLLGVPREERATRKTGYKHFGLNILTTILFAVAAVMLLGSWRAIGYYGDAGLPFVLPLLIAAVALALVMVAGSLGWKLVQTHHVGIEEPPEPPQPELRSEHLAPP